MSKEAVDVPLTALERYSAFIQPIWSIDYAITRKEVSQAIRCRFFLEKEMNGGNRYILPQIEGQYDFHDECLRDLHIWRVAYLVTHPDTKPIFLDVGIPHLNCYVDWIVQDGHHRLAAAFYRNDKTIPASIAGCIRTAEELLGISLQHLKAAS